MAGADVWRLCKTNFHLAIRNNFILAAAYLLTVPLLRGIANLDMVRSAECLEQSAALVGIFLIVPLSAPEQQGTIREIVSAKKISYRKILLLRYGLSLLALILMTGLFAGIMRWNRCTFPFVPCAAKAVVRAAVPGSVGFAAAARSRSAVVGYLVSAGYFLLRFACL